MIEVRGSFRKAELEVGGWNLLLYALSEAVLKPQEKRSSSGAVGREFH
jgi:hypothetical protein